LADDGQPSPSFLHEYSKYGRRDRSGRSPEWRDSQSGDRDATAIRFNSDIRGNCRRAAYAIDVHTPLAYGVTVIFVETPAFCRWRDENLDDEEFRALQNVLIADPHAGDVIPGARGLRKLRVALEGRGKRGGARVIYSGGRARSRSICFSRSQRMRVAILRPGSSYGWPRLCGRRWMAMDEKDFEELLGSVRWMKAHQSGKKAKGGRVTARDEVDVRKVRALTKLSQEKFADLLSIEPSTLRNWEQGRRQPTGAARALLRAIHNDPVAVLRALKAD
jgi:putative transcriptional regulator